MSSLALLMKRMNSHATCLVRAVLVDEVGPREQRARARARLLARQRVHLEVHVRRVLLEPAEEPRLAEDDRGALLPEGVFRIAERQARHLVLVDEIAEERERRDHLAGCWRNPLALYRSGLSMRAPQACAKGRNLSVMPTGRALAADGEPDLRGIAALRIGRWSASSWPPANRP